MKRPYDLRHSGVTWRLNSGVPATEVAAWAGHSVEVLTRVYARCVIGLEGVWIGRMDQALHLEETDDLGRVWAAMGRHGPQNSSDDGIRWHDVSEDVKEPVSVPAGHRPIGAAHDKRPSRIRTCAHGSGESANLSL